MSVVPSNKIYRRLRIIRITLGLARHWLAIFILIFGLLNLLPFVAPVAMRLGWIPLGNAVYTFYSMLCHQMAQRSFFLFGSEAMYNLDNLPLQITGSISSDMPLLREFRGNQDFGWKVAWSDRMVAMYGGMLLASIAYGFLRRSRRISHIPVWGLLLLTMPLAIDGITHMLSDTNGLDAGFRYTNEWLVSLTKYSFPDSFYRGDILGSFNSWMRLVTGLIFGVGTTTFGLPIVDQECRYITRILSEKLAHYADKMQSIQGVDTPNGV